MVGKVESLARRVTACVLTVSLMVGLLPTLPEVPRAFAEESKAVRLGGGKDGGATTDATIKTESDDAVVLDEDVESAILGQLEQIAENAETQGSDTTDSIQTEPADSREGEEDIVVVQEEPALETQSASVSNPRVVADSSMESGQVATWDCVWFGSYPQTEVAPGDAAYASLQSASWDSNGDTTVGGRRYRRISKSDVTSNYYWSSDGYGTATYRYFHYEPIKWRVLEVKGTNALVVADEALDDQSYNVSDMSVTWETSSIRSWLNGYGASSNQPGTDFTSKNFIGTAFSASERGAILTTNVVNANGTYNGTAGGNNTFDMVFLLSEAEVNYDDGVSHGFATDYMRRCNTTAYAHAMGDWRIKGDCWWWLRSPGANDHYAVNVDHSGRVDRDGDWVIAFDGAVRPALNLNLTSTFYQYAGTVSSNGAINELAPTNEGGISDGDTDVQSTTMTLGADASGSVSNGDALKFFPGNFSVKSTFLPVEFSKEIDDGYTVYKVGIGIGRKNLLDKEETWNQFKANVEDAKKGLIRYDAVKKKTIEPLSVKGFKVLPELGITGYGEYKYKDGTLVSKAGSLVADANWEAKANWQFATPIGPIYLELKGGVKADLTGKVEFEEKTSAISFGGNFSVIPNISLEGGYGIMSVATVGVQGSAEVPIQVVPPTKGEFGAKASLHAYIVFVVDWSYDLAQFKTTLWDTTQPQALSAQSDAQRTVGGGTFSEVDRGYAEHTTEWSGDVLASDDLLTAQGDEASTDTLAVLQRSVMPNTVPHIAQVGDKKVMVFQQNDASRTTLNSSVLVYSVLDGGVWSEPRPIWDTGTLDAYADLQTVGDDLYVTWQKEKAEISGDVSSNAEGVLESMAANSEICVARFDAAQNAFVDARYVTNNSQLDMMPAMAEGSGSPQVAFVRNTGNSLDQSEGATQVVVASWGEDSWSESVIAEPNEYVSGLAANSNGGQVEVAYATMEGEAGTESAHGSVYLGQATTPISSEGEQPTGLQWQDGKLYWTTDGLVKAYDGTSGEVATLNELPSADADDGTGNGPSGAVVGDNMRVVSNGQKTSVVWTSTDSEKTISSVYSALVEGNGLTDKVELYSGDFGIAAGDVLLNSDGTYDLVANTFDAEGVHNIVYSTHGASGVLETAGASVYAADNGFTALTYGFTNNSELPVNGYIVRVSNGSEVIDESFVSTVVAPGAFESGEALFTLGPDVDVSTLTVEVFPADTDDARQGAISTAEVTTDADLDSLVEEIAPAAPEFKTQSLTLGGTIGVNFYADLSPLTDEEREGCRATFTVNGRTYEDGYDADFVNKKGYHGFTCPITSVEMADEITATLSWGDGKSITKAYSVAGYMETFEQYASTFDEETRALVRSVADYGHYVQPFLARERGWEVGKDHKEMPAASTWAGTEAEWKGAEADEAESASAGYAIVRDLPEGCGFSVPTQSLVLDSGTDLCLYVVCEEGVSLTGAALADGTKLACERMPDGRWRVTIPGVRAHELGKQWEVRISSSAGMTGTVRTSALAWVRSALVYDAWREDQVARDAAASIWRYAKAAEAYRAAHPQG